MRKLTASLLGRTARVRWVHLVLGGALLMPFWLLGSVLAAFMLSPGGQRTDPVRSVLIQLVALALALPMAWVAALLPVARVLLVAAARALAGVREGELAHGPPAGWAAQRRTAHWFALYLLVGGVVSGLSLATPPAAVLLWAVALRLTGPTTHRQVSDLVGRSAPVTALVGLGLLVALVLVVAAAGALLARCAPALLGPTAEERLAAAERRTLVLAQRNRLARELHDSVGHALSAVAIQASAARRVLERDPAFAAEALRAIEEVARDAVGELDTVLGVLREEVEPAEANGPTLAALDLLVRQLALAGVEVTARAAPEVAGLSEPLSREAYRIVQEGLTNVLRHAGPVPAELRLDIEGGRLMVELTNPIGADRPSRPGGGRGLRGVAERAAARGGGCESGRTADGGRWRLAVWLPVGAA
ncbi:sensor histidine kinase [Kitasatospora viridis]|uniref:histidine kinase n=1 Tax=Kitasatospora viridis TaxID=281105 RepID=A0A561UMV6_9ACTN|nr:histidine kinase [Kitasatospora viridis]TWG00690.1 signal transduction histidine kinase [Kitasatospora viridis]